MKIVTILGTRPEIIRLCRVIPLLDTIGDHVVVHTGQNYDIALDQIFFDQLGVRKPDHHLGARGTPAQQIGAILTGLETILQRLKPDRFLVLGDTNSSMGAIIAKRLAVPVYHMEAGNRCYDDRVPEEVNRRIIDHSSDVLMPYTERSRQNLLAEGIPGRRIYVTGNPIFEVMEFYRPQVEASSILSTLGLAAGEYFLVTLHRAENVDIPARLASFVDAFAQLAARHDRPVIVSTHPRTKARLASLGLASNPRVRFLEPFGFFDFMHLEKQARCVLSDSGTVQEECAILKVPNVTLRDVTERPETIECGSNYLTGADMNAIIRGVDMALSRKGQAGTPVEYTLPNVSNIVANIVTSYRHVS